MAVADYLQKFRKGGYGSPDKGSDAPAGDDKPSTPRIISLTDDEKKEPYFTNAKPGEDLVCEVHGTLESDGHFHVMSVHPMGQAGQTEGAADSNQQMAEQVMNKIAPPMRMGTVPSPS